LLSLVVVVALNQPMLNEKLAITLQADNHRTHQWGPDAFPGNNLEYEEFADNKVEYQKGNRTTDYDGFFSERNPTDPGQLTTAHAEV
jgi:hypothetical protein